MADSLSRRSAVVTSIVAASCMAVAIASLSPSVLAQSQGRLEPVGKPPTTVRGKSLTEAVAAAVERSSKALSRRDWATIADAGRGAADAASLLAGLRIRHGAITAGPHRGPGVYEPAPGGVVSGRHLYAILEVDGVVPEAQPDGRLRHTLEVSGAFSVVGDDGSVEELGVKDLGTHQITGFLPQVQQTVGIDVLLGMVPPGGYAAAFTVREPSTGQSATTQLRFRVP